jgi:hypothetical protein
MTCIPPMIHNGCRCVSPAELPADWSGTAIRPIGVDAAFNGYLAANVIFALDQLGIWELLDIENDMPIARLSAVTESDKGLLGHLLKAAAECGYVQRRGDEITLTCAGRQLVQMRGYFTWAVGGYQEVFGNTSEIVSGAKRFGADVHRNDAMVARGSGLNDKALMAGILEKVLADVGFRSIADLGSGTAARLCRVVAGRDGARGLAIDISEPATRLAERTIRATLLGDRVTALRTDVLDVFLRHKHREMLREIDTVMSFFLLHDLLADPGTRHDVLPSMREAFPQARTFLLADTMLRPARDNDPALPVFSVGYELAHALMGIPLHSREIYEALFAEAGLTVENVIAFGTPYSWLYVAGAD